MHEAVQLHRNQFTFRLLSIASRKSRQWHMIDTKEPFEKTRLFSFHDHFLYALLTFHEGVCSRGFSKIHFPNN